MIFLLFFTFHALTAHAFTRKNIDCYVTHGVNQFNGEMLVNFSRETGLFFLFPPAVYEIGAYNPNGNVSNPITPSTPADTLLATTRDLADEFGMDFPDEFANTPITNVGTMFFGSTSSRDRIQLAQYEDGNLSNPYTDKNVWRGPTVGQWSEAAGRVSIECDHNGGARVRFELCGALPKAVYTVWAVGCKNCRTASETLIAVGAGGLPNILLTDEKGNGAREWEQPWCPGESWGIGGESVLYFSAFLHFDHQVYGMSPALSFLSTENAPTGYVGSNHLWCAVLGKRIKDPSTKLKQCKNKQGKSGERSSASSGRKQRGGKRKRKYRSHESDSS